MFGSSEIECLESGKWSTKDIQCRRESRARNHFIFSKMHFFLLRRAARECSPPDHPLNGRRVGANWTCSATVEFECDDGYYLVGSSNRTCQPNENWDGEETECLRKWVGKTKSKFLAFCSPAKDCGKPKNPRNGRAEYENKKTTYQSIAVITCDECCEPADVYNTTCLASGEWSRPYPVCRGRIDFTAEIPPPTRPPFFRN